MIISNSARIWLCVLGCILLVPIAAIPMQDTAALQQFHNRSLSPWPPAREFLVDPAQYFTAGKRWLADRVYPIIEVSFFQKKFFLYVLDTPPQHRVTMGMNGFIFLNGADEGSVNNIFETVCVRAHSEIVSSTFKRSLSSIVSFSQAKDLPIDVVIVPTLETLYGDRLPLSVPRKYRAACGERAAGKSPLAEIEPPPPLHYVFPFTQMHAARDDDAFFPQGNWHPTGLSLKVVRDAYLSSLGVHDPLGETLTRTTGPSELLLTYGIYWYLPVYRITDPDVLSDGDMTAALKSATSDLFPGPVSGIHVFSNLKAPDQETLLMLSDSYGDLAAPVFAGGFRHLIHITTNDMRQHEVIELLKRVSSFVHYDRLVIFVQEGNTDRVVEYSEEFRKYMSAPIAE